MKTFAIVFPILIIISGFISNSFGSLTNSWQTITKGDRFVIPR